MSAVQALIEMEDAGSTHWTNPEFGRGPGGMTVSGGDFVYNEAFTSRTIEDRLFGDGAEQVTTAVWTNPSDFDRKNPPVVVRAEVLPAATESLLFLRYNYARYRLHRLLTGRPPRPPAWDSQLSTWRRRALRARADLVQANMALVVAMAKRARITNVEFEDLISEGNMALLRSVDKFDVARGFRFSTYACRAILKSFSRLAAKTGRYQQRCPVQFDPELEKCDGDGAKHDMAWDDSLDALRRILAENRAALTELEKTIILQRFGLARDGKGQTLVGIAEVVRVSKESVRQILRGALEKIRCVLDDQYLTV
jgi:RNA polymerase primary sigma factor